MKAQQERLEEGTHLQSILCCTPLRLSSGQDHEEGCENCWKCYYDEGPPPPCMRPCTCTRRHIDASILYYKYTCKDSFALSPFWTSSARTPVRFDQQQPDAKGYLHFGCAVAPLADPVWARRHAAGARRASHGLTHKACNGLPRCKAHAGGHLHPGRHVWRAASR